MGTHWIDELAAEKTEYRRELEPERRRRALAAQKLASVAPDVWIKVQKTIFAAVDTYNRRCPPQMCLGVSPGPQAYSLSIRKCLPHLCQGVAPGPQEYSLCIRGESDANPLTVRLDVPTATIFCTDPVDGKERNTFQVSMVGDSKWNIVGFLTKRVIPLDQIIQVILKDFITSTRDRIV
jgi:hypothetical protein